MPKARVLVTGRIPRSALQRLDEMCDVDAYNGAGAIPREDLLKRVHGQHGLITLITETVDRELLASAADLRVVANVGVGYNNIDVAAAHERGIVVTNTPDVLTAATADFTWALILAITRRLPEGDRLVRR